MFEWVMFAVGIAIGICIGVVCMTTEILIETYIDNLKKR